MAIRSAGWVLPGGFCQSTNAQRQNFLFLAPAAGVSGVYLGTRFVLDKVRGTPLKTTRSAANLAPRMQWENLLFLAVAAITAAGAIIVAGSAAAPAWLSHGEMWVLPARQVVPARVFC